MWPTKIFLKWSSINILCQDPRQASKMKTKTNPQYFSCLMLFSLENICLTTKAREETGVGSYFSVASLLVLCQFPVMFILPLNFIDVLVQLSSVVQLCPTLCNPMNRSMPGLPVHHQLPESTQTHVHWLGDTIQPSHPLSSPSPPALNLSQHQGLFRWVSSLHQGAKVLEFQLQHQSFQWTLRTDLL